MYILIIFLLSAGNIHCLTCEDVVNVSSTTKVNFTEFKNLSPKEIVSCLSHLRNVKFNNTFAEFIWKSIIIFYKDVCYIPEEVLSMLNTVTIAVTPKDYKKLSLNNVDVITNFGRDYGLRKDQLLAIAERVREDFGGKTPEDYTFYDLKALRQILCVFDGREIKRIHPISYKEVALLIGRLKNCNYDVLEGFATLALSEEAFGSPDNWTRETICIIGAVAKYLPDEVTSKLKKRLGSGILKEADRNITKERDCY